jgi:hypothetical protein
MNKQTTAKLCGVIRDGLNASPKHADNCHPNARTGWRNCPPACRHATERLSRALAALDQLEAGLLLEK